MSHLRRNVRSKRKKSKSKSKKVRFCTKEGVRVTFNKSRRSRRKKKIPPQFSRQAKIMKQVGREYRNGDFGNDKWPITRDGVIKNSIWKRIKYLRKK